MEGLFLGIYLHLNHMNSWFPFPMVKQEKIVVSSVQENLTASDRNREAHPLET